MINHIIPIVFAGLSLIPLILLNINLAPRYGLIDWPKSRGVAQDQIPIVGYSLVFLLFVGLFYFSYFGKISGWVVAGGLIIAFMGHSDDRKPVAAIEKLFLQILACSAVVIKDPLMHAAIAERYGVIGSVVSIFFMVGLINAVNFIDGIDGLAGLVLGFGALGFVLVGSADQVASYRILSLAMIGMLVVFLYFNIKLRKGFLGNIGSYFLSYLLAVFHLSAEKSYSNILSHIAVIGLFFLIPIADALTVTISRILSRRSPMAADKGHFHHKLMQANLPLRWILLCFGFIQASSLMSAYTLDVYLEAGREYLPWMIGFTQLTLTIVLLLFLDMASKDRVSSFFKTMNEGASVYFLKYQILAEKALPVAVLKRIESKIESEIRISDHCYLENENTIHVVLRVDSERLKVIMNRLRQLLESEGYQCAVEFEYGEYRRARLSEVPKTTRIA